MNTTPHISEAELKLIDQYLNTTLPAPERTAFEERMATDIDWQQKVEEIRQLSLGIQEAALRKLLPSFHEQPIPAKQAVVRQIKWIKKLAVASIFLAVIGSLGWLLIFNKSKEDKLYAAFYQADPGLPTEMGMTDNYQFSRSMMDYKAGNYKEAIKRWEQLLLTNPVSDTLHYFTGLSYLAINQTEKAVTHLNKVVLNNQSVFKMEACWYLGLACLKQNKRTEAASAIRQSDNPRKADLLLKLKD